MLFEGIAAFFNQVAKISCTVSKEVIKSAIFRIGTSQVTAIIFSGFIGLARISYQSQRGPPIDFLLRSHVI